MAKTISQIKKEWKELQKDLLAWEQQNERDIDNVRNAVRAKILQGEDINPRNEIEVLLKKEYELEQEENRISFTAELITQGKNPKSPSFKHELDIKMVQSEFERYDKKQIDDYRKVVQKKVLLRERIQDKDAHGQLLLRELQNERALTRISLEEEALAQGYKKGSPSFRKFVDLKMIQSDLSKLDAQEVEFYRRDFQERKSKGEKFDVAQGYYALFHQESTIEAELDSIAKEEERKKLQEEEQRKKAAEAAEEEKKKQVKNPDKVAPKGFFARLFSRRKPKKEPVITAPEDELHKKQEKEQVQTELDEKEKKRQEKQKLEEEKERERQEKRKLEEERERERQEKRRIEEEKAHRYKVEFAGKSLKPEIRNCGDPKKLAEYLQKTTRMKKEIREHLEARIRANAKIEAYEKSRANIQKNRPPAVKYKDGTILLKNKKKDVPKQTSMNGCWSAVLSDMLAHFGVDLSQEEIRAYRPDLSNDPAQKKDGAALMDRLNKDAMNEINDMADLIQRTVPNVAHHHMSLGTNREKNKAVLKAKVTDALLNKNSPVAVLYGNHYLSIVGIKDNTLIVQNSSTNYDSKYQKLTIDDLFEGCKGENGMGQVTIDWLEDLKFEKNGTCKNATKQWERMGIQCNNREFKAGTQKNQVSHVRGNEYFDTSRIEMGIEETIYLPKMSFGREKDLAAVKVKQQQLENVASGIMTMDQVLQDDLTNQKDEKEIEKDDMILEAVK